MELFSVFLQGVFTFLSPCLLPMLPIYFSYLSADLASHLEKDEKLARKRFLLNTFAFVLGFSTLFVLLGASASRLGRFFITYQQTISQVLGFFVLLLGLMYFLPYQKNLFHLLQSSKLFASFLEKNREESRFKLSSCFFFGMAMACSWQACTSPQLAFALLLASQEQSLFQGVWLLILFSLGLAIPFMLFAYFFQQLSFVFQFLKRHGALLQKISGIFFILVGLFMIFGQFGHYLGLFT